MIHAGYILFLLSHISLAKSCYGLGTLPFIFGNCSPTTDFKWEVLWYFTLCCFRVLASLMQSSSIWKRGVYTNQWYSSAASALERHKNEWNAVAEMCSPRMLCQVGTSDVCQDTFQTGTAEQTGSYTFTPQFLQFHSHLWWLECVKVWVSSLNVVWYALHLICCWKIEWLVFYICILYFLCPVLENADVFQPRPWRKITLDHKIGNRSSCPQSS